jgi:hypothetical protein
MPLYITTSLTTIQSINNLRGLICLAFPMIRQINICETKFVQLMKNNQTYKLRWMFYHTSGQPTNPLLYNNTKISNICFEQQLRPLSSSNQRARIQYELLTMFVLILVCPQSNCHLSKFITIFALNHQLWFQSNLLLFMTGGANPGMSRMSLFSGCTSWNFERY